MTAPVDQAAIEPTAPIRLFVPGRPAPQGSKDYVAARYGRESSPNLKPWRQDVREALLIDGTTPKVFFAKDTPVWVCLAFVMPRPKRLARKATPAYIRKPDADKLARAVLDAISSAGVWHDDYQVVFLLVRKRYANDDETTGCHISLGVDIEHLPIWGGE